MKKLVNDADQVVEQMIAGMQLNDPSLQRLGAEYALAKINKHRQAMLISGGGSGHEPLDLGYVGAGMLDVAITGEVFLPPTSSAIVNAVKMINPATPILFIVKNFEKDVHSFTLAQTKLRQLGYQVALLIVSDDKSVNPTDFKMRSRGVAGTVFIIKILGALADQGATLEDLLITGQRINEQLYTLGVALEGTEIPGHNQPFFKLQTDEIFYGVGIHGEPGYRVEKLTSSELLARELVNKITQQITAKKSSIAVLVNGLGGLPLMDQLVFTNDAVQLLELKDFNAEFVKTGNYLTSYGMRGLSLTVLVLQDDWLQQLKAPANTLGWN